MSGIQGYNFLLPFLSAVTVLDNTRKGFHLHKQEAYLLKVSLSLFHLFSFLRNRKDDQIFGYFQSFVDSSHEIGKPTMILL